VDVSRRIHPATTASSTCRWLSHFGPAVAQRGLLAPHFQDHFRFFCVFPHVARIRVTESGFFGSCTISSRGSSFPFFFTRAPPRHLLLVSLQTAPPRDQFSCVSVEDFSRSLTICFPGAFFASLNRPGTSSASVWYFSLYPVLGHLGWAYSAFSVRFPSA